MRYLLFVLSFLFFYFSCSNMNKSDKSVKFTCDYLSGDIKFTDSQEDYLIKSYSSNHSYNLSIIDRMMSEIGLSKNFVLIAYDGISNAAAINIDEKRIILFNENFMSALNNSTETNWSSISVIAHEIGHHLEGHTIESGGSRPNIELEADKFSGFIMYKMGASLEDAISAISLIGSEQGSITHPPKYQRINAITEGYQNAEKKDKGSNKLYEYKGLSSDSWIIHSQFGETSVRLLPNGKLARLGKGNNKNDYWEIKGNNIFLFFHWDDELDWTYQGQIINPNYIKGGATSFDGRGIDWHAEPGFNN